MVRILDLLAPSIPLSGDLDHVQLGAVDTSLGRLSLRHAERRTRIPRSLLMADPADESEPAAVQGQHRSRAGLPKRLAAGAGDHRAARAQRRDSLDPS